METLKTRFVQFFREVVDSGRATMSENTSTDSSQVELHPLNLRAARIRLILPKNRQNGVTLILGKGSIFEIPENGGRYTEYYSAFEEAEAICKAVLEGRFQERVTIKGERVVRSKGTITLPHPVTARWGQLFQNPFSRSSVQVSSYEAY